MLFYCAQAHVTLTLQARAEVQMHGPGAIRLLDVQGLLLWILADGMNPRWCFVKVRCC